MKDYGKTYKSDEEMNARFAIFKSNYLIAQLQLEKIAKSAEELNYGITQFMDLSPQEFAFLFCNLNPAELPTNMDKYYKGNETQQDSAGFLKDRNLEETDDPIPDSWDWREHGAVQKIKIQGVCGACWAFSAVSSIESAYFLKHGKLLNLSEQQMVDCDTSNSGCLGGIIGNAIDYSRLSGGLVTSANYPYLGYQNYCTYNPDSVVVKVKGFQMAGTFDEDIIKEMLYKKGPLAITINANTLQFYQGGIIDLPYDSCPYAPSHGVNIVGYGVSPLGLKYWICRNTWGDYWGEGGYFRIARGRGLCGVNGYVIRAIVE